MFTQLFSSMLLGLVQNHATPVSTRLDTDTGVGSVSDSSDMAEEAEKTNLEKVEEALSSSVVLRQNPASFRG